MLWTGQDPHVSLLVVGFTTCALESFDIFGVAATIDVILETLGCRVRVALSIDVLGFDTGDEASVTRDALVSDLMLGSVHPGD